MATCLESITAVSEIITQNVNGQGAAIALKFCFVLEVAALLSEGYKKSASVCITVFKSASNNFFWKAEKYFDGIFVGINVANKNKNTNISIC